MTERVTIYTLTQGYEPGTNIPAIVRTTIVSTWAEAKNATSAAASDSGQVLLQRYISFRILKRNGLTIAKNMKLTWNERDYTITSDPDIIDKRFIEIRCANEN